VMMTMIMVKMYYKCVMNCISLLCGQDFKSILGYLVSSTMRLHGYLILKEFYIEYKWHI